MHFEWLLELFGERFLSKHMNKVNIIQFMPYFPPHKWWVETVWEEIGKYWIKKNFWEFINIVSDIPHPNPLLIGEGIEGIEKIIFKWEIIWYKKDNYEVLVAPSFEIINNFPIYKFWTKKYRLINLYLKEKILSHRTNFGIFTHTRFFVTSLIWWLFARKYKLKWIHIEHWSDYVKLWSLFKSKIAYVYDKVIWKWIFKKADKIVAISEACKNFINSKFINREIEIIYNWINFISKQKQENEWIIKIWFVWRLVNLKGVDLFIEVFKNLSKRFNNIELEIVWDWEKRQSLERQVSILWITDKINFLWLQNRKFIANNFLPQIDIFVNPSFQEWLPTTVLEWLLSWCVVVASDVWWTYEISSLDDLILVKPWDLESLENWLEKAILNYKNLRWKSSELVKEKFDWDKNIEKYFNLCNSLWK